MDGIYSLKKPDYVKKRKRVGRGNSSGHGSQSGKGHDGQLGRAGRKRRAWFEGGQMPLQRRVPKRGFSNYTKKEYQIINVAALGRLSISDIDPAALKKSGIIAHADRLVKVLGVGEISKPLKITADKFSKTAADKIKKAGGEAIVRALPVTKKLDS